MAETFGVKGRAKFYDSVGAIRDVVQNHLLQLVACIAMELPPARGHEALRAARSQLLAQLQPIAKDDVVRGQVRGYTDEEGVEKDSKTETFATLKVAIDSPRWKGVPFFIRAGKQLAVTTTEAVIRWRRLGHPVLEDFESPPPNHVRFRVGPDAAIAVGANVKKLGEPMVGEWSELVSKRDAAGAMKAYERLLGDAIDGDATLFSRKDAAEESWRVVDPIVVRNTTPVFPYAAGSWGPEEAKTIAPEGGWVDPVVAKADEKKPEE